MVEYGQLRYKYCNETNCSGLMSLIVDYGPIVNILVQAGYKPSLSVQRHQMFSTPILNMHIERITKEMEASHKGIMGVVYSNYAVPLNGTPHDGSAQQTPSKAANTISHDNPIPSNKHKTTFYRHLSDHQKPSNRYSADTETSPSQPNIPVIVEQTDGTYQGTQPNGEASKRQLPIIRLKHKNNVHKLNARLIHKDNTPVDTASPNVSQLEREIIGANRNGQGSKGRLQKQSHIFDMEQNALGYQNTQKGEENNHNFESQKYRLNGHLPELMSPIQQRISQKINSYYALDNVLRKRIAKDGKDSNEQQEPKSLNNNLLLGSVWADKGGLWAACPSLSDWQPEDSVQSTQVRAASRLRPRAQVNKEAKRTLSYSSALQHINPEWKKHQLSPAMDGSRYELSAKANSIRHALHQKQLLIIEPCKQHLKNDPFNEASKRFRDTNDNKKGDQNKISLPIDIRHQGVLGIYTDQCQMNRQSSLSEPSNVGDQNSLVSKRTSEEQADGLNCVPPLERKTQQPGSRECFLTGKNNRNSQETSIYDSKIDQFVHFIAVANLAHRIYEPIFDLPPKSDVKYRYYLGPGNNCLLIRSLLKRRFWWVQQSESSKAHFIWTQLKISSVFQAQKTLKAELKAEDSDVNKLPVVLVDQPIKMSGQAKFIAASSGIPSRKGITVIPIHKRYSFVPDNFLKKEAKILMPEDWQFANILANRVQAKKPFNNSFQGRHLLSRKTPATESKMHNHFEQNYHLGNKKALFHNLRRYCEAVGKDVFELVPLTFHIKDGIADNEFKNFMKAYADCRKEPKCKNLWIVKPGELSNRGNGITVIEGVNDLRNIIGSKQKHKTGESMTYIVQKYMENPLLYKGRKFDMRHYMLVSRMHGRFRAYWYAQGYVRTSSEQFSIEDVDNQQVHLTNDAIQKYGEGYGKYQEGNKVSYTDLQKYLELKFGEGKRTFEDVIYPQMREAALESVRATFLSLDPESREHNFQIFGLDFMVDANLKVWLIEVNTNPCLELSSKLLSRIIPTMVEQAFRLSLDLIFPIPSHYPNSQKHCAPDGPIDRLLFQIMFDEDRDGQTLRDAFKGRPDYQVAAGDAQQEEYQSDGKQIDFGGQMN